MPIFEMRTYQVITGKMADASKLYAEKAMPALVNGGFDKKLVGYFISDTGALHQLVHLWKFDDDADRRDFWAALYQDAAFMEFAGQIRPLLVSQHNQLFKQAPWGPQL